MFEKIKDFIGVYLFLCAYSILKLGGKCLKSLDRFVAATFFKKMLAVTFIALIALSFYAYPILTFAVATYLSIVWLLAQFMGKNNLKHSHWHRDCEDYFNKANFPKRNC